MDTFDPLRDPAACDTEQAQDGAADAEDGGHELIGTDIVGDAPVAGDYHADEAMPADLAIEHHGYGKPQPVLTDPTRQIATAAAAAIVDVNIFEGFPAAPLQPGEFRLPLCDLVIGRTSDGGVYDFDVGAAESLLHAVKAPDTIAPIVVTKVGDAWHVTDGWARVGSIPDAVRQQRKHYGARDRMGRHT